MHLSPFFDNKANCFMYSNRLDSAEIYFKKALHLDSSSGDRRLMSDTYYNLAELSSKQKNLGQAKSYLQKAIQIGEASHNRYISQKGYHLLSLLNKEEGDFEAAYLNQSKASQIKDSIHNLAVSEKVKELDAIYENEKKELELLKSKEAGRRKTIYLIALSSFIPLLVLIGFYFYRRKQMQTKIALQEERIKLQEKSAQQLLEAEENFNERIAKDLHDGVGQMISAAKFRLSALEPYANLVAQNHLDDYEKAMELIDGSYREIREISHNLMPENLSKLGLKIALEQMVGQTTTPTTKIELHTEGLEQSLDKNVTLNVYRSIQEALNNALKYAQASHIQISLFRTKHRLSILIEDNGIGFDINEKKKAEGIGIRNIMLRISSLKGKFELDSKPSSGTTIAIHIPLL